MTWVAITDGDTGWVHPTLEKTGGRLDQGSMLLEFRVSDAARPHELLRICEPANSLTVIAIPDFGFIVEHGTTRISVAWRSPRRLTAMRLMYHWNSAETKARLMVQDCDGALLAFGEPMTSPPLSVNTLITLSNDPDLLSSDVTCLAFSSGTEPVVHLPGLLEGTPVACEDQFHAVETLNRGDRVLSRDYASHVVLNRISGIWPAIGFLRPIRLKAPYLGLRNDVLVAPHQRVRVEGTDVEYVVGQENALIAARHLVSGPMAQFETGRTFVRYHQLLLRKPEVLNAGGAPLQSLYVGRLRRNPQVFALSSLRDLTRTDLPEHGQFGGQTLSAHEALDLALRWAA